MSSVPVLDGRAIPVETRLQQILGQLGDLKAGESLILVAPHHPEKLLRKLLSEFPGRYEFSPLHQTDEAWSTCIHVRDAEAPRTVMLYLAWDHDRLDALLIQALEHARTEQWEEAQPLVNDFKAGLFRHIDIEERILFKAFEDVTGMHEGGPTAVMRHEHVQIKECVESIAQSVTQKSLDAFEKGHADLLGVLVEHNMKEENILYPSTDRALDDSARTKLVEELLLS